jgi:uncharacterized SAM-binding protein YcdF (DUF218 family)
MTNTVRAVHDAVRRLWNFHCLGHREAHADAIICFGGNDLRVAVHAAELMLRGCARWLVVSGGVAHQNDLLRTSFTGTESSAFAQVALQHGVPAAWLLEEPAATNTAENLRCSRQLIQSMGLNVSSLLLVCKPHMQRRILATAAVELPEIPYRAASFTMSIDEYCNNDFSESYVAQLMVGDLQRLELYAARGFSAAQRVPTDVRDAWQTLVDAGYDKHLVRP